MSLVLASEVMGMPMIVGAHTEDEVQLALDRASDAVESYCERQFGYASETVCINPYRGSGGKAMALLPNPPVWGVTQVLAEMPNATDGLDWVPLQFYQWAQDGLLYDTTRYYGYNGVTGSSFWAGVTNADGYFDYGNVPSWPSLPRSLKVTYSHGFNLPGIPEVDGIPALPSAVRTAVIGMASFYLDNFSGTSDTGVGEVRNRYFDPTSGPAGWLDEKLLGEYRLVHL